MEDAEVSIDFSGRLPHEILCRHRRLDKTDFSNTIGMLIKTKSENKPLLGSWF